MTPIDRARVRVRVLVVEDSLTVRKHLVEVLEAAPGVEIVGEASDGRRAVELCQALRPDVVTMDMVLPSMSGLEATEQIMAWCPTPILIVSASRNRGELFQTYEALAAGAVDVLDKPPGHDDSLWGEAFIGAVRRVARIRVITHPRARLAALGGAHAGLSSRASERRVGHPAPATGPEAGALRVIGIGASTGGPGAVLRVLRALPRGFPVPVLVVIHISELFAAALSAWFDAQCALPVREVDDGMVLPSRGQSAVLLATPGHHLELDSGRLRLTREPERHACRPSVDVLFESLAREQGRHVAACLLTGMGRDGAQGLLDVRRAGGATIAQDEASSVVFGMPRSAIELGAAGRVLPLDEIGPTLVRWALPTPSGGRTQS